MAKAPLAAAAMHGPRKPIGLEDEFVLECIRGAHSSTSLPCRLGFALREGFRPENVQLSVPTIREEFHRLPSKFHAGRVTLCCLETEPAATVQVLLSSLEHRPLPQKVVHGIDRLEEECTLQEFIAANPIPEDEEVLPVQLTVLSFLEEEEGFCIVRGDPAEG